MTFSEAQQLAVEGALRRLRLNNPEYEVYFEEAAEEPFFIKNLENVQGDERDTIVFSIGYAKDQNGIMHMNFGPLSRNGGYRRLNVAITRAKYNVKLVGSILPTDIDLERTSSEGVKMLRTYIEFALKGPEVLLNEIVEPENIYTESIFEEEVYQFLVDKGFKVATQVGCSGYRIDLAIRHPTESGRYILGIECDGASYHSARTARERDRLRQSVLEDRGWIIYRIWSTDWIKDSENEGKRLLEAIQNSLEVAQDDPDPKIDEIIDERENVSRVLDLTYEATEDFEYKEYEVADPYQVERKSNEPDDVYARRVIKYILEIEGPIHFELICKRMAPLFGNERVTKPIKGSVLYLLKGLTAQVDQKDNFYHLKGGSWSLIRVPGELRSVQFIPVEEKVAVMKEVLENSYGLDSDGVIRETARLLGFGRVSPQIKESLSRALDELLKHSMVELNNGKLSRN